MRAWEGTGVMGLGRFTRSGRRVTRQIMEMTAAVRWADSGRPFMDHHHHSFSCPSPTEPSMTSGFKFDWNSNKTITGLENKLSNVLHGKQKTVPYKLKPRSQKLNHSNPVFEMVLFLKIR